MIYTDLDVIDIQKKFFALESTINMDKRKLMEPKQIQEGSRTNHNEQSVISVLVLSLSNTN